jgi:phospholipase/carboxylesterase
MYESSLLVARPEVSNQLILLFHGVGSSARDLEPVARAIGQTCPRAFVVSVDAPHLSQLGRGKEWFSVVGVNENNRPKRIAQAMPLFLDTIRHWQNLSGVGLERTVLLGFSQGAIMSLESTQSAQEWEQVAHTVISLAGRFAEPVRRVVPDLRIHLIHGDSDTVVMPRWSIEANEQIKALSGEVTLDMVPGLGHGIDARVLQCVVDHLS